VAVRRLAWCIAVASATLGCRRVDDEPRGTPAIAVTAAAEDRPTPRATATTFVVPDFARIAAAVAPSVVTVIASVEDREGERAAKPIRGVGSGMIVSANGQVLTNQHVIANASAIEVELAGGQRLAARVVFADDLLDLALLGLERESAATTSPAWTPVEFAQAAPSPGAWVMAVGQPFGLGHTVTVGVVGGLGRDHDDLGRPDGLREDGIWSFIQTDASINIGNSGGPLVDADGRVAGITTAVRSDGQGLAFAVPAEMARRFLDEVWTFGRVRHTRLGMNARNAEAGVLAGRGSVVQVTAVEAAGPAANAGIEVGDIVLAIDGVRMRRVTDVAYRTQLLGVGARLTFTIARGDAPAMEVTMIPAESSR
jgi:S1-C subfamily serine protease